jgi:hypothetical protein
VVVDTFEVTMVMLSSLLLADDPISVGSEEWVDAETKLLHLFSGTLFSAPHRQALQPNGSTVLCIPFVHGSYPTTMNCCAFLHMYKVW